MLTTSTSAPDWASISRSFEFNMLGRVVEGAAEHYGRPIRYDALNPAPSDLHAELSQLLWELQPLIYKRVTEATPEQQRQIHELQQAIEDVKRQLWVATRTPAPQPKPQAQQQKLF